jgi:hypothetical protein
MSTVLTEIAEERIRQDTKYGFNRKLLPREWYELIKAEMWEAMAGYALETPPPHDYRVEMIQVAALCVAAIESWDLQNE